MRVIPENVMPGAMDREIRRGLCRCFPADAGFFTQTRAWNGISPLFSVVLEDDARVLAHAGVVERRIMAGGAFLRAAGVQNVFVLPEGRGKGMSGRILKAAMAEAATRGFDIGLLFCIPALEKLYASAGWLPVSGREIVTLHDGREAALSEKNIAMFHPLRVSRLPEGALHLQGAEW